MIKLKMRIPYDQNTTAKISTLSSDQIDKYEYLTGEEILPSAKSRIIKQDKLTYFPLEKTFEKQIKQLKSKEKNKLSSG